MFGVAIVATFCDEGSQLQPRQPADAGRSPASVTRESAVLDGLRGRVAAAIGRIQKTSGVIAQLDVWSGFAHGAVRNGYARPEVNAGSVLHLEGSRHPVVERMMAAEAFIPNDVRLDESGRVILLTGPNMAGKSTVLRQVGLCVLMAQIGEPVLLLQPVHEFAGFPGVCRQRMSQA